jgi:hypothetical protein
MRIISQAKHLCHDFRRIIIYVNKKFNSENVFFFFTLLQRTNKIPEIVLEMIRCSKPGLCRRKGWKSA